MPEPRSPIKTQEICPSCAPQQWRRLLRARGTYVPQITCTSPDSSGTGRWLPSTAGQRETRDPSPQPLLGGLRPIPSGKQSNLKEPADRADQPRLPSPSFPNPLSPGVSGHRLACSPRALKDGHNVQKYNSAKRKCDTHNTSGRDYNTQNAPGRDAALSRRLRSSRPCSPDHWWARDYITHNAPGRGHISPLDPVVQLQYASPLLRWNPR